ncbi:MAG: VOC family protein [Desulfatitalea sp.]|nr:VOC family protein [Desulfatitalea sp.]
MIRYSGINHLALVTGDMTATIRFWRDLLGMRLVAGLGRSGYRHYFFEISAHDMISFFEWPEVHPIPEKDHGVPVKGPAAFDHVAIGVSSDDDLWEIRARLEAAGFWASEVIDHGFIHSLYSFDPNRIPIEFSAPVASVNLRNPPPMHDTHPLPIALEGPNPVAGHWPEPDGAARAEERIVYPGEGRVFAPKDPEAFEEPSGDTADHQ